MNSKSKFHFITSNLEKWTRAWENVTLLLAIECKLVQTDNVNNVTVLNKLYIYSACYKNSFKYNKNVYGNV